MEALIHFYRAFQNTKITKTQTPRIARPSLEKQEFDCAVYQTYRSSLTSPEPQVSLFR